MLKGNLKVLKWLVKRNILLDEIDPPLENSAITKYSTAKLYLCFQEWYKPEIIQRYTSRSTFTRSINNSLGIQSKVIRINDKTLQGWGLSKNLLRKKLERY